MEHFQTRILIQHIEGATIAYLYNRESFDLLKVEYQTYDNSQFIEIGQILEYDNRKYRVKNVNFRLEKEFYKVDNSLGVNLYSPTDISDFNSQIGIFVENI